MATGRKQHKHRRERGRLGKLFQLLCVLAVLAAMTVGATVFFQVEEIVVVGNSRYSREEVVAATGIQSGDNLFRMNKFAIQDRILEQMPYVEEILIRRDLPSTIVVTMQEWDAVAEILPNPNWEAPEPEDEEDIVPRAAEEGWLISVGGKLLESAQADHDKIKVSGLTALDARAGIPISVPELEQHALDSVISLLAELEHREMLGDVSEIEVGTVTLVMEYLGRYDVKLPLNADVAYEMDALLAAVADREQAMGEKLTGSFDLTQAYTVVYSPERIS